MSNLYRDYRPNNFSEVLGQNHIKITLQNEILANQLGHAYLFCGPRAVGKTTTARILAKTINCLNRKEGDFEPCDKCENCLSIKKGNNLDVLEIDAASNTGVDNVRENIISFSRIAPSNGKYKVFIIDEVHMLSPQAFNALLKIMEEPPSYVVFILCTTEIHKVPGTIISRCERFDFKKISLSETITKLSQIASAEKISVDKEVLEAIAKKSGGYMRDAESLFGQILSIGGKEIKKEQAELILPPANDKDALSLIENLSKKDAVKAFVLLNSLSDSGVNMKVFSADLVSILRRLLIDKISPGLSDSLGLDLGESLEKDLIRVAGLLKEEEIILYLKKFMEAGADNRSQNISQLPLEIAVAEICFETKVVSINSGASLNQSSSSGSSQSPSSNLKQNFASSQNSNSNFNSNLNNSSAPKSNLNSESNLNSPSLSPTLKTEEKKEAPQEIVSGMKASIENLSQEEVYKKWPEVLVKIKNQNHSLSFVMQSCRPGELKDSCLCLSFKYKFHQNRVNEVDIKEIVRRVLSEVYGEGLDFIAEIDENLMINQVAESSVASESPEKKILEKSQELEKKEESNGSLGSLLNVFGGEVIS